MCLFWTPLAPAFLPFSLSQLFIAARLWLWVVPMETAWAYISESARILGSFCPLHQPQSSRHTALRYEKIYSVQVTPSYKISVQLHLLLEVVVLAQSIVGQRSEIARLC